MREIFRADSGRLLTFHCRYEHTIIINKCYGAIGTHHNVVGLYVTMCKWLRAKPCCHLTEAEAEHRHSVRVMKIVGNICFHSLAVNPVHKQHWKLLVITVAIYEQLFFHVSHRGNIRCVNKLKLISDFAVSFSPSFLFLSETFKCITFSRLLIFHFEYHCKGSTASVWFAMIIKYRN